VVPESIRVTAPFGKSSEALVSAAAWRKSPWWIWSPLWASAWAVLPACLTWTEPTKIVRLADDSAWAGVPEDQHARNRDQQAEPRRR